MSTRIAELRDHLAKQIETMDAISASFKFESKTDEGDGGVGIVVTAEQKADYQKALSNAEEIRGLIEMEEKAAGIRRYADEPVTTFAEVLAQAQALGGGAPTPEFKGLAETFLGSEAWSEFKASGGLTMRAPFEFDGRFDRFEQKDVFTSSVTGTTTRGFGRFDRDPMVPRAHRSFRVRDLFPARATAANLIDFFKVTGFTNNASVVAERGAGQFHLKNQSSLTFEPDQAPVRTIAHYEAAHRSVLSDEPQLQGVIENELLYGLQLHEDFQILQGAGTGENLTGILNVTGVQSQAKGGDTAIDAVRKAITLANLSYYEPTGCVLHPNDWEGIELAKDSENRYLLAISVAMGAEQRLWRLPVVATPAMPEGTGLVGSFGIGAQLYDREQGNIRIAEQHSDFFVRNAVVILAEQRLALATKRPESFVKVTGI